MVAVGLGLGLFLTGLSWISPVVSNNLFNNATWFWVLIIVGTILLLLSAKLAQEQHYPVIPKPVLFLTVLAATALVYLFPELFAPGCNGMPRAFAACPAACRIVTCSDWAAPGERGCNAKPPDKGCCFAYQTTCDPACNEPDPTPVPANQPPTISGVIGCNQPGKDGWCVNTAQLILSAIDPQGFSTTITGDIAGVPFSCNGPGCSLALPAGSGSIHFQATTPSSGLSSAVGNLNYSFDPTPPSVDLAITGIPGASGWYKTANVSSNGSDGISGLASNFISVDGGNWKSSAALAEGIHSIIGQAIDNAGNETVTAPQMVKVDGKSPDLNAAVISGTLIAGWYTTDVIVKANALDTTSGISLIETRLDDGTWLLGDQATVSLDGEHSLDISTTDYAGNVTSMNMIIKRDTTPPSLSILPNPDGVNDWYISLPTLSLAANDPASGLAGAMFSNGKTTTEITTDGIYNLSASAADLAGNTLSTSKTVRVDTTPPTLYIPSSPDGENNWYISLPTLSLFSEDKTSGLNSALFENGKPTITASSDGIFHFSATASDIAGNLSSALTTVLVDTTPPSLSISVPYLPDGLEGWYVTRPTLSLVASDSSSGLANAAFDNGTTTYTPAEGEQVISATAKDNAGNITRISQDIKVDTTLPVLAPVISGSFTNGWYNSPVTISINTLDTTSGVNQPEYRLDGGDWQSGSGLTVYAEGEHSIDMRVTDRAGNISTAMRSFKLDTSKPISAITNLPQGNKPAVSGLVSITGSSSDKYSGLSSVEISVDDGKTWLSVPALDGIWSYKWDTRQIPDGTHSILVKTEDRAGNLEEKAGIQFVVGNMPPLVEIQPSWWLWDSGYIRVKPRQISLGDVSVRISCAPYHPDVVLSYNDKNIPSEIKWDRRCGNGAYAAESGDYSVTVKACDVFGNCSNASGVIKIPFLSLPVPSWTPTSEPTAKSTELIAQNTPTPQPVNLSPPSNHPLVEVTSIPTETDRPDLFSISVLSAFVIGFFFLTLSDPRPRALRRLANTIQKMESSHEQPLSN